MDVIEAMLEGPSAVSRYPPVTPAGVPDSCGGAVMDLVDVHVVFEHDVDESVSDMDESRVAAAARTIQHAWIRSRGSSLSTRLAQMARSSRVAQMAADRVKRVAEFIEPPPGMRLQLGQRVSGGGGAGGRMWDHIRFALYCERHKFVDNCMVTLAAAVPLAVAACVIYFLSTETSAHPLWVAEYVEKRERRARE